MPPQRSVIQLVTAPAGTGKTYSRVRFLVDELLPESELHYWHNLPLREDAVAEYCETVHGMVREDVLDRLHRIPEDIYQTWLKGESGPWEFFEHRPLDGCHLEIDEIHRICGLNSHRKVRKRYQDWLGEIRHRGATCSFISQDEGKIAKEIHLECAFKVCLISSEDRPDWFFKIPLADWYEIRAMLTGKYTNCIWEVQQRRTGKKYEDVRERQFWITPKYYDLYDSYSAPQGGGLAGGPPPREYERRSPPGLVWWFIRRNGFRLAKRGWFLLLILVLLGGGGGFIMRKMFQTVQHAIEGQVASAVPHPDEQQDHPAEKPQPERTTYTSSHAGNAVPATGILTTSAPTTQPGTPAPPPPPPSPSSIRIVIMLRPDGIVLQDGESYRVGDTIEKGEFHGVLQAVNVREGVATISGVPVRLGVDWVPKTKFTPKRVPSGVSTDESAADADPPAATTRSAGDDLGGGRPAAGVPLQAGVRDGDQHRGTREP